MRLTKIDRINRMYWMRHEYDMGADMNTIGKTVGLSTVQVSKLIKRIEPENVCQKYKLCKRAEYKKGCCIKHYKVFKQIKQDIKKGIPRYLIARKYKVAEAYVTKFFPFKRIKMNPAFDYNIYDSGASTSQIAEIYGVFRSLVGCRLRRSGAVLMHSRGGANGIKWQNTGMVCPECGRKESNDVRFCKGLCVRCYDKNWQKEKIRKNAVEEFMYC